jgi:hypothetical protein
MTVVTICTTCSNIKKVCILRTECIYMICMILTTSGDYFLK